MREQLIDFLKRELVGPDPCPPYVQENGEEILTNEPPRLRYSAGILFPQKAEMQDVDKNDENEEKLFSVISELEEEKDKKTARDINIESSGDSNDSPDHTDNTLNQTNSYLPSAMGFSCFLNIPGKGFVIKVKAGRYSLKEFSLKGKDGNVIEKTGYARESIEDEIILAKKDLPDEKNRFREFPVKKNKKETGLVLNIRNRSPKSKWGTSNQLFTFSIINKSISSSSRIDNENCFFQVEFSAKAYDESPCFMPYPERKSQCIHEDDRANELLYRKKKTYAIGHGCAPTWIENTGGVYETRTEVIPCHEVKPILPSLFPDLSLSMYDFSDKGDAKTLNKNLKLLCDKYETWINSNKEIAAKLDDDLKQTALLHIENCNNCTSRMREGVDLIKSNLKIRRAFNLMNRAMLLQQLHYNLPLREWKKNESGGLVLQDIANSKPIVENPKSWPDWDEKKQENTKLGKWRPFQIAFILMNLKAMAYQEDKQREIVDLVWFSTGGGKTEAYLGLTAYTIFLKRLNDKSESGTTVLMRYTLRLLTAQQYQRAASLITACDLIREENIDELGEDRITLGLWAGLGLTPNTRQQAVAAWNELYRGQSDENKFIILKCPWCGARMGQIRVNGQSKVKGYFHQRRPSTIIYKCDNTKCEFSTPDHPFPLKVIDEDIYDSPPTLVIGTVDKFALIPWRPEARSLFGFRKDGTRVLPPELIIQDELHLISGPLGSMVAHYETLISELCKNPDNNVRAKIIASTATISRARQQCHGLYNCGESNVFLFPPQCLEAGNSFFAYEDNKAPGRIYSGVYASAGISNAMAQIRVISSLLQGTKSTSVSNEQERDPYWTVLGYFNSLRELGHAATLINADIRQYIDAMWLRKGIRKEGAEDPRRFINKYIELTSRIPSYYIPQALQALEVKYPIQDKNYPVDICLATNMISVGVDVQRLGLMTIIGQPKTTSEYIQASSRVGRSKDSSGLIVTIFNVSKPRDRSHYEHFHAYHSKFYSYVEPTSITPFSTPVRERALHAIVVGMIRYFYDDYRNYPQPFPDKDAIERVRQIICNRIKGIDESELELGMKLLNERFEEWRNHLPPIYGDFSPPTPELRLMYPAGSIPHDEWEGKSWPTQTSLRNIDASCEARVISNYIVSESEE